MKDREPEYLDKWFIPRFSKEPMGARLIEERKANIPVGEELTAQELELFF